MKDNIGGQMSEKRFTVDDDGIYDTQEKKHFKFIAYDWIDCDIYECCEKLNEQQATINLLLDLLHLSEEIVIGELSSHIGEDLDKLDKLFKRKDIKEIERFVRGCRW